MGLKFLNIKITVFQNARKREIKLKILKNVKAVIILSLLLSIILFRSNTFQLEIRRGKRGAVRRVRAQNNPWYRKEKQDPGISYQNVELTRENKSFLREAALEKSVYLL